ncbi:hypothetical protein [Clostridium paraputrificum]|uniref:hypothetical protein n=1 Tax=Clostridium paraputrificum TaxID=29363 RepID=UPI001898D5EC|nr:hypothetical protein [Clostridium paraputrificum]MDB2125582.1 hypothetical protein [Clostridium paraputrificum]
MRTINELEKYLEENCYSFQEISIGNHRAYEGIYIEQADEKFIYGYSERGIKRILQSFDTEEELVHYALNDLSKNKWNKAHLVAWTWNEIDIEKAERDLRRLNITFERNDIRNFDTKHRNAYRIFVFGKDVKKLSEFILKYYKR